MPSTKKALGKECIAAMVELNLSLREKEHKLAGYVRHGIKNNMGTMTTLPTEQHNKPICHDEGHCSVRHHTHAALRLLINRIARNFRACRAQAHSDLVRSCVFSNAWTSDYLIWKGQALLNHNHTNRKFLKSARLSRTVFISWNFDIGDWVEQSHPLHHVTPHMLRVNEIHLHPNDTGTGPDYIKCICGEHEGIGVPWSCFFRQCEDVELEDQEMIDPCMLDVQYWKICHTHYPGNSGHALTQEDTIDNLILWSQAEAFENEGKGICVPRTVMSALLSNPNDCEYPIHGKNTTRKDLVEAMFTRQRPTTTVLDIKRFWLCKSPDNYVDKDWSQLVNNDDFCSVKTISKTGKNLQERINRSIKEKENDSTAELTGTRPTEEEKDAFFVNGRIVSQSSEMTWEQQSHAWTTLIRNSVLCLTN